MTISGLRPHLAALLTAVVVTVGLLSLSSLPALATRWQHHRVLSG
jgi:hypothetical protein